MQQVEKEVKKLQKEKKKPAKEKETLDKQTIIIYQNLEENLKGILGTKINIQAKDADKGKIEIEYYSKDELDRIVGLLRIIRM